MDVDRTDYKWLADSIAMTGERITKDIVAALEHARDVPGENLTPARVDRLCKLLFHLEPQL